MHLHVFQITNRDAFQGLAIGGQWLYGIAGHVRIFVYTGLGYPLRSALLELKGKASHRRLPIQNRYDLFLANVPKRQVEQFQ